MDWEKSCCYTCNNYRRDSFYGRDVCQHEDMKLTLEIDNGLRIPVWFTPTDEFEFFCSLYE